MRILSSLQSALNETDVDRCRVFVVIAGLVMIVHILYRYARHNHASLIDKARLFKSQNKEASKEAAEQGDKLGCLRSGLHVDL